jgi:hypothetical protein
VGHQPQLAAIESKLNLEIQQNLQHVAHAIDAYIDDSVSRLPSIQGDKGFRTYQLSRLICHIEHSA